MILPLPLLPLSPPFHPQSLLSFFARCKLGVSRFSRCCHLFSDLCSISRIEVWPGVIRSHRNSALGFESPSVYSLIYAAATNVRRLEV